MLLVNKVVFMPQEQPGLGYFFFNIYLFGVGACVPISE